MRRFLILLFVCWAGVPTRLNAETADEYVKRAKALIDEDQYDEAIAACNKALAAANPEDPKDRGTIFSAYDNRGSAWHRKGECDKAIADYTKALVIDPQNAHAYYSRGLARGDKGEHDKAIDDFNEALAIDPKNARSYNNRGFQWSCKGEYEKAIADHSAAMAINPKDSEVHFLAQIYATCPNAKFRDGKKAVENAKRAQQLSDGKQWMYPRIVAAAYAESGDFKKAKEWQEKAIVLAPARFQVALRTHLELYKQGKPYHEQPVKK